MNRPSFLASSLAATAALAIPARAADGLEQRIDELTAAALASNLTPGMAVAVVRAGMLVNARGFGVADTASRAAVDANTAFAIGSLTKQFVAAVVLQLVAQRRLRLEEPLATWEPRFAEAPHITLRDLLQQTSGLHNYPLLAEHAWPISGTVPTRSIVDVLVTDRPDFAPGTRYAYSNANYAVLAAIVERVEALPFAQVLRRRITGPLGMARTGFGTEAAGRLSPATPYAGRAPFERQKAITLDLFSGAGAMISTARDLARWDLGLLRGGVLDDASRALAFSAGTLRDGSATAYAMGWVPTTFQGRRAVWHNGLAPGAGGYCYNMLLPDDALAVVVLSNGYDFRGQPERLANGVLTACLPGPAKGD